MEYITHHLIFEILLNNKYERQEERGRVKSSLFYSKHVYGVVFGLYRRGSDAAT